MGMLGRLSAFVMMTAVLGCSSAATDGRDLSGLGTDTDGIGMPGAPAPSMTRPSPAIGSPGPADPGLAGSAAPAPAAPVPAVVQPGPAPAQNDPDNCPTIRFEPEVEVITNPGNVLLVFDRSGSMEDSWEQRPRWQVAGESIDRALAPIADQLTIGSVFFPSEDPDAEPVCTARFESTCELFPDLLEMPPTCGVNAIDAADQLGFAPGTTFLNALATTTPTIYQPIDRGSTPLLAGLQQAQSALSGMSLSGNTSVVIITDGRPNCEWNAGAATQVVSDWLTAGIRTYVIGLPGSAQAEQVLGALAQAGGTGAYLTPTDPMALESELRSIAQSTLRSGFSSCEIPLTPATEEPDMLRMVVRVGAQEFEVPRQQSPTASWTTTPTGDLVTLQGDLCADAMAGSYDELRFEFSCTPIPQLF